MTIPVENSATRSNHQTSITGVYKKSRSIAESGQQTICIKRRELTYGLIGVGLLKNKPIQKIGAIAASVSSRSFLRNGL